MSDTPETDKEWRHPASFDGSERVVHISVAQKRERERDEARDTIFDVLKALGATVYEGPRLAALRVKSERDEAREALREIAEASGFDNIGNWARNKAKSALYR